MNDRLALVTVAAVLAAAGCSIPYAEALVGTDNNFCSSDGDCLGGSTCAFIGTSGVCVAKSADLDDVVFEVQPALGSGAKSSSTLLPPVSLASAADGEVIQLDLTLPSYVDVAPGRVFLPCAGEAPVPARVTFQPVPDLAGLLGGQKYEADSVTDAAGEAFQVSIPPGLYNIYLEPKPTTAECQGSPPIFLPRQRIDKDTGFAIHAAAPLTLTGTLKLSEKEDFTKWSLEVVEPLSGKVISEIVNVEQLGIALQVPFSVKFDWTASAEYIPVIRLRPPDGAGKPVIHWRLDAVALQGVIDSEVPVHLDVSGIDTQPRKVAGNVAHDGEPVAATVTLRSTSISGDELTRYETTVETDQAGSFESALPPGEYDVIARPHRDDLARGLKSWKIVKDTACFCANTVNVPSATTVAGAVYTPSGAPAGVEVRLAPAATPALAYLGGVLTPDVQPRPAGTFTEDDGSFQLSVDVGEFDLSIAPPQGSGYPWLVRPRFLVSASDAGTGSNAVKQLDDFQLQSPVAVRGLALDANGNALGGATVRAWVAVGDTAGSGLAPSAVQIGEAVADEEGVYMLLLPPSIKVGK